jgi:hypothetical protein
MFDPRITEQLAHTRAMRARGEAMRSNESIGDVGRRRARMIVTELRDVEIALISTMLRPIFDRLARFVVADEDTAHGLEVLLFELALHGTLEQVEHAVTIVENTAASVATARGAS